MTTRLERLEALLAQANHRIAAAAIRAVTECANHLVLAKVLAENGYRDEMEAIYGLDAVARMLGEPGHEANG